MKILLIQSYLGEKEPPVLPLGLAIVAANLDGHEIQVLDMNIVDRPFDTLEARIKQFEPNVIGISIRNIDSTNKRKVNWYYEHLKPLINTISQTGISLQIIVGGAGFSMFARAVMEDLREVDFGVYLEGEETLPELLDNIENPDRVKGVFYRKNGDILFTGERKKVDLSNSPGPRWALLDMERYTSVRNAIGIETKRGCSLSCLYCPYAFLNGRNYRLKPVNQVVDEIEELKKVYNVRQITFTDSIFNLPLSHAENICKELIKRNLSVEWTAWFNEKNITKAFLLLARKSGCIRFIFSPDAFSDKTLERLRKNIRKADIMRTFSIIREIGNLPVSYNFFKNPPGQTPATALKMLTFIIKAKAALGKNNADFELSSIRIEPHTHLCSLAQDQGMIDRDDDLLYPKYYSNPSTLYIEKIFNLLLMLKGK